MPPSSGLPAGNGDLGARTSVVDTGPVACPVRGGYALAAGPRQGVAAFEEHFGYAVGFLSSGLATCEPRLEFPASKTLEMISPMSQFAQYELDSPNYDTTRVPFGLEIILGCLTRSGIPLDEQTVLEAGCGTGNYVQALLPVLGSMVGVDYSQDMLDQARATVTGDVELMQGDILQLPMADGSFDAVLSNQVIHHLDEGPGADGHPADWPPSEHAGINGFLREAYRVLRPNGALVMNFSNLQQVRDGFWWADLIPAAVERMAYRLPSPERLRQMIAAAGFNVTLEVVDLHGVLQGKSYLDAHGPLKDEWRAGDSTWSLTTAGELDAARERVERMHEDGTIDQYLSEREVLRRKVGQSVFLCARK